MATGFTSQAKRSQRHADVAYPCPIERLPLKPAEFDLEPPSRLRTVLS